MKLLRKYIQEILLEYRELTPEEIEWARTRMGSKYADAPPEEVARDADLTGLGIQGPEAIDRDKHTMRTWHFLMKQNPSFVKDFMEGKVQILHSLTYEGLFSNKEDSQTNLRPGRPFTRWVKKFGGLKKKSRDQISCVVANAPIGADPQWHAWDQGNAGAVFGGGYGFLMKGYPAFVGYEDFMSPTLSAISQSRKEFHKNSGQVKRPQWMYQAIDLDTWYGSDEAIIDNWQIIGVYMADYLLKDKGNIDLFEDAFSLGVPVYRMQRGDGTLVRIWEISV
jgi:hypothetical protein